MGITGSAIAIGGGMVVIGGSIAIIGGVIGVVVPSPPVIGIYYFFY